ncbi:hypothetical protein, partial [Maritalea sp.]|uniref:hypothetical protein n=1 Tax=Maritalea sp. TaxID=2003361 RepID=UPI003EF0A349
MKPNLFQSFDPFKKPYPGMDIADLDMDQSCQNEIEERDPPHIADKDVIETGRKAIAHFEHPTELGVYQQLGQSGLTKIQIEQNLGAILMAAGPRFMGIYHAMRLELN